MKKLKKEYLQLGRLLADEQKLRAKLKAIQDARTGGAGRSVCTEWSENGVVLCIPLPELLAMFPEAKAELSSWTREDGSVHAYHRFGPEYVGDIRPGFHFWVKHETRASEVVPAKSQSTEQAA